MHRLHHPLSGNGDLAAGSVHGSGPLNAAATAAPVAPSLSAPHLVTGDTRRPLFESATIRMIESAHSDLLADGTLMARAARAVADEALAMLAGPGDWARAAEPAPPVLVLAGPGNNGADALLSACLLHDAGRRVQVVLTDPELAGSAPRRHWLGQWRARQNAVDADGLALSATLDEAALHDRVSRSALIIDGLYGLGSRGGLSGEAARVAAAVNRRPPASAHSRRPAVLSIDLPSGLDADRGAVAGPAIIADRTLSLIADKPGLHTGAGADHAGLVSIADLGLGTTIAATPAVGALQLGCPVPGFRLRRADSHKGSHGHLLVVGGAAGMSGAALLAAGGAQALGIGKLEIMSPDARVFDPAEPQWMTRAWGRLSPSPDAVVIGCGLGRSSRAAQGLALWLASALPLVVDADALALLAGQPRLLARLKDRTAPTVITPHPLEAARLLGVTTSVVQADRVAAARRLASLTGAAVVLKGAGSVVFDGPETSTWTLNASGGPVLATAGSGDVLAGMVGALLAQGLAAPAAARLAVWTHGRAGDRAQDAGVLAQERLSRGIGLRAVELPRWIRIVANLD